MRIGARRCWYAGLAIGVLVGLTSLSAEVGFEPPTFKAGPPPVLQLMGLGGGEVRLELTIDPAGRVAAVKPLRSTAGFTQPLSDAVRSWQFTPASDVLAPGGDPKARGPVSAKVLVVGMFRPPTLMTPTLGEPVRDLGLPSPDAPKAASTIMPTLPPMTSPLSSARGAAIVLAEITIDADGRTKSRVVIPSGPDVNAAALAALKAWQVVPARVGGRSVTSRVYAVLAFSTVVV